LDLFEVFAGGLMHIKTDLYVPDSIPLAFTRTSLPLDDWSKRFHFYVRDVYDPNLYGDRFPYTYLVWQLPDGAKIRYQRISPGTGYADAIYEHFGAAPVFGGSRLNWNGDGWDLSLTDGTTYLSPEAYQSTVPKQGSLVGIFDKDGNEVRLSRTANGDLTEIHSPTGRWIRFAYNDGRMVQAKDSSGQIVDYDYDSEDRLETVRYPTGHTTTYSYDSSNRIIKVEDSSNGFVLENKYDSNGLVTEQKLADGRTYNFRFVDDDERSRSSHLDIIDSKGELTRVRIKGTGNETYYTVEKQPRVSGHR